MGYKGMQGIKEMKKKKRGPSSARRIAKAILLALLDTEDEGTTNICSVHNQPFI